MRSKVDPAHVVNYGGAARISRSFGPPGTIRPKTVWDPLPKTSRRQLGSTDMILMRSWRK